MRDAPFRVRAGLTPGRAWACLPNTLKFRSKTPVEQLALRGIDRHPSSEPAPGLWPNAVALVDVVE